MRIHSVELSSRSHPELNPKVSAYHYLEKWRLDKDVYISLTNVDKIGINPQSKYNTPLGIYAYPLCRAWSMYRFMENQSLIELPFAAKCPHIWVLKVKNKNTFVDDLYKDYGSDNFDRDLKVLKQIYFDSLDVKIKSQQDRYPGYSQRDRDYIRDIVYEKREKKWANLGEEVEKERRENSAVSFFWLLTKKMAEDITLTESGIRPATKWNWILRQCGYSGFADKTGRGIIHPAEPMQAVFLSTSAFTVIGSCDNKDHVVKDARLQVDNMLDFIKAYGKMEQRFDNCDEEYSFYLLSWLLGTDAKPKVTMPDIKITATQDEIWDTVSSTHYQVLLSICETGKKNESGIREKRFWNGASRKITELYEEYRH